MKTEKKRAREENQTPDDEKRGLASGDQGSKREKTHNARGKKQSSDRVDQIDRGKRIANKSHLRKPKITRENQNMVR